MNPETKGRQVYPGIYEDHAFDVDGYHSYILCNQ